MRYLLRNVKKSPRQMLSFSKQKLKKCKILWNCRIAGYLKSVKERGFCFWRKPKVAKTFRTSCEILGVCILWGRFCVAESRADFALDSAEL